MNPAVRIVLAPIAHKHRGLFLHGEAHKEIRTVFLDPRSRIPLAKVLLHELLHVRHPDWSETRVERETSVRWRKMGWRDKARLFKLLGRALLGSDGGD